MYLLELHARFKELGLEVDNPKCDYFPCSHVARLQFYTRPQEAFTMHFQPVWPIYSN